MAETNLLSCWSKLYQKTPTLCWAAFDKNFMRWRSIAVFPSASSAALVMLSAAIHPKPPMNSYVRPMRIFKANDRTNQSDLRLVYTGDMTHVAPVFTEYEQHVIRELAVHRVQPNAVHRLLESAGRPVARLLRIGRDSNSKAVRGLTAHVHGWIEEGLIKTF